MADGPAGFTQDFTCPALLRVPAGNQFCYAYGVFTFFDRSFQTVLLPHDFALLTLQPHISRDLCGLGSSPFARRYWGNHCLFSSPAVTKMFQFTAFALLAQSPKGGVSPFGYPRINGCLHLPAAFRSLSRPSSPLGARASSVRPCCLLFCKVAASRRDP